MLERARAIGGHLDVTSDTSGTHVELRVPLPVAGDARVAT
jgi:signal transduction histidine kinase